MANQRRVEAVGSEPEAALSTQVEFPDLLQTGPGAAGSARPPRTRVGSSPTCPSPQETSKGPTMKPRHRASLRRRPAAYLHSLAREAGDFLAGALVPIRNAF
jgi:hypothetical protein